MPLRAVLADVCEADSMFQDGADVAVVVCDRLVPLGSRQVSFLVCSRACLLDLRQDELKFVGISLMLSAECFLQ